ncbi:MAG: radical SAM protein [Methanomassiliicoccales archaeon]|nr:MAG: radical SAM protein [Methanomassiliicoccales archaeon]
MTVQESKASQGLPKKTQSLCPDCKAIIDAEIFEENGKVIMKKECKEHGEVKDIIWSDADLYLKAERYALDGLGVDNPNTKNEKGCPLECGLCDKHFSHTALSNIDLTNRCNLKCPICFANANAAGYVYEPSYEEVVKMLELLRAERPVATLVVQFSGGEPTIYPRFIDVVKKAKELGFSQVQMATNGIKLAKEPNYAQILVAAGMHTVYLQFDGLKEENYTTTRGQPLLQTKIKAIENCRRTKPKPLSTALVPTIVKTINDDQVGPILDFAIENCDVVKGVNYQPVAFTGRISKEDREKQRFTLTDLVDRLVAHSDFLTKEDFFPVPSVAPLSYLASVISNQPKLTFTCHAHCGIATYLFIEEDGKVIPLPRFIDIEGMMSEMMSKAETWSGTGAQLAIKFGGAIKTEKGKQKSAAKAFKRYFGQYIDENKMPEGLDIPTLLSAVISDRTKTAVSDFTWKTMFVGGMHFQDLYNYDIQRVQRCAVHYATPDGRLIPFCSYNGGPTWREEVEKKFSVPLSEWRGGKIVED